MYITYNILAIENGKGLASWLCMCTYVLMVHARKTGNLFLLMKTELETLAVSYTCTYIPT